jgi:hypothetical protein
MSAKSRRKRVARRVQLVVASMSSRLLVVSSVIAFALAAVACSSTSMPESGNKDTTVFRAKEAGADVPARLARIVEAAAANEDPSRTDVHANVVSHDDWKAIIEVTWNERAPNDVESLDDATMHVVRRFAVRGREEGGVLGVDEIEAIAPKAWEVTGSLVACVDGRSDLLTGESATEDGSCIVVARGGHVAATGESITVPAPGPIPTALAYRVRLPGDSKAYWTIPAHSCLNDIDLEDGTVGRAIGSCSYVGVEEPRLFED